MNLDAVKKVKHSKPFTVSDAVVTAVLLVAIGVCAWLAYRVPAQTVVITAPGYEQSFPLDRDAEIELEHLTVHIQGGKVWVSDSDCADKTCVLTGKIKSGGQSIVCLPSGVVITIDGSSDIQWELGR